MIRSRASTLALAVLSVIFLAAQMNVSAIICGGFFLLGVGEWINHPTADLPRKANWLGILLEVAGGGLMVYGTYLAFR
jgi:hypothetical protein